jgi:hypothetical protein
MSEGSPSVENIFLSSAERGKIVQLTAKIQSFDSVQFPPPLIVSEPEFEPLTFN